MGATSVPPPRMCQIGRPPKQDDKDICLDNLRYHRKATKKTAAERAIVDHGEGSAQHPNHWAVLEDKAYHGIQNDLRVILPTKRKPRRGYSQAEYERNVEQSSDRVLVENFFGRSCQIGGIVAQKYVWSRERIDVVIDIVFSLTNYHILLHPLRAADGEYYQEVMAELKRQADEAKTKGARRQREYRQRQASVQAALEGMDDRFTDDDDEDEESGFSSGEFGGGLGGGIGGGLGGGEELELDEDSDDDDDDDDDDDGRFARRQAESVSQGRRIMDNAAGELSSSSSSSSSSSDDSSSDEDDDGVDAGVEANGNLGGDAVADTDTDGDEEEEEEQVAPPTPTRRSNRKRKARKLSLSP